MNTVQYKLRPDNEIITAALEQLMRRYHIANIHGLLIEISNTKAYFPAPAI